MACTNLNVVDAVIHPDVLMQSYGFAEIEGANRGFEDPCEEDNIVGLNEAVKLVFEVKDADVHPYAKIRFTINYLRPGETVKSTWYVFYTLATGTYTKYVYHTDLRYKLGMYTGLTIGIDFV